MKTIEITSGEQQAVFTTRSVTIDGREFLYINMSDVANDAGSHVYSFTYGNERISLPYQEKYAPVLNAIFSQVKSLHPKTEAKAGMAAKAADAHASSGFSVKDIVDHPADREESAAKTPPQDDAVSASGNEQPEAMSEKEAKKAEKARRKEEKKREKERKKAEKAAAKAEKKAAPAEGAENSQAGGAAESAQTADTDTQAADADAQTADKLTETDENPQTADKLTETFNAEGRWKDLTQAGTGAAAKTAEPAADVSPEAAAAAESTAEAAENAEAPASDAQEPAADGEAAAAESAKTTSRFTLFRSLSSGGDDPEKQTKFKKSIIIFAAVVAVIAVLALVYFLVFGTSEEPSPMNPSENSQQYDDIDEFIEDLQ